MERKGISPLIAAVLLIAFTMAIASLFAQWAPQLMQSAQADTKNQSEEIQRCSGAVIEFVSGSSTDATLQQVAGDSAVGNVSLTWFYTDGDGPLQGYANIDSIRGTGSASVSPSTSGDLDEIRAQPIECQGAPGATYS